MLFFSITITIVGYFLRLWKFKDININKMFFPFASCTWYFLTGYILLIIFIPFINKLIKTLSQKEYLTLLIILLFTLSIWPSLA